MPTLNEITREMSQIIPKIMRYVHAGTLSKINVTPSQMIILVSINEHGKCKVSTLAKERDVSPPTVTGITDRLVKTGYIKRSTEPEDRRVVLLSLTKKGEQVVNNYVKGVRVVWKSMLADLTEEEQIQYLKILKKIVTNLSKKAR